ncbi:MAG: hypothetical protein H0W58_00660 [Acidobacteria bacterium]|nr:hypothetical protein [Acidobacteriota bacterium]
MNPEDTLTKIRDLLELQNEWLLIHSSGKTFALQKNELELEIKHNKILFSFLDEKGFQTWRVVEFRQKKDEILLELTRNFEKERERIRLVPRISAGELDESIELARLEKANKIANLLVSEIKDTKLVRVALNKENGRFAQIFFEHLNGKQTAVLADVSGAATPEILISTAILWLSNLERRKKKPIETVWILAEKKLLKNLRKLHALLKENWKSKIKLWEISRQNVKSPKSKVQSPKLEIVECKSLDIYHLWREKPKKIFLTENISISQTAREIIKLAPEKIDVLFTKQGETLRFEGLPFARVRKMIGEEKCWFGIERDRRILNEKSREDFFDLLENLETYRRFDTPNKRHALFGLAPEAWLEAALRRNIKLLDGNLILSPIYNQFRAEHGKIDLLALRRDGRLIIIELKVSPDREMAFQAVDYWRKIELNRRRGNLNKAKLFGDLEIADAPTLCYLVAPTLSFHRDFKFLANTVSPEIEIYRFNLAENWRKHLQVMKVENILGT